MHIVFQENTKEIYIDKQRYTLEEEEFKLALLLEEFSKAQTQEEEHKKRKEAIKEEALIHLISRRKAGQKTLEVALPNGTWQVIFPVEQTYDQVVLEKLKRLLGKTWFNANFTSDVKLKPTKGLELWIKSAEEQKKQGTLEEKSEKALDLLHKALRIKERKPTLKLIRNKS